jgi:hypothetical protein
MYGISLKDRLDKWLDRLMREGGVPLRHIDNFRAYVHTPAFIWADKWNFRGFLVLSGVSGAGKSFAAAWVIKKYLKRAIPDPLDAGSWFCAVNACENMIWASANRIAQNKDETLRLRAWSKRLLVMDDLGREGDSSIRRTDLSDVISARYDRKAPTVITTELTFADILGLYGRYTAYKLTEDRDAEGPPGGGMFVNCGDISLRNENEEEFVSGFEPKSSKKRG